MFEYEAELTLNELMTFDLSISSLAFVALSASYNSQDGFTEKCFYTPGKLNVVPSDLNFIKDELTQPDDVVSSSTVVICDQRSNRKDGHLS